MSKLPTYFDDFMDNVRLTAKQRDACEKAHQDLRDRLSADKEVSKIVVGTFLQGSYRRFTGVRPMVEGGHLDVDLVVATTLSPEQYMPAAVVERFRLFLDREYPKQWSVHDRSIKISPTGSDATLDFVVTSAPSEIQLEIVKSMSEAWRMEARGERGTKFLTEAFTRLQKSANLARWQQEPLLIPSRDLKIWEKTHPLEQIRWTEEKNGLTGGHYVNVVKGLKWWWGLQADAEYPKGYPLEHVIGQTCADGIDSVAAGVVSALETIRDRYRGDVVRGTVPSLPDHGVPEHDVFARLTAPQFAVFWRKVEAAAADARAALELVTVPESAVKWRSLFGEAFPAPPKSSPTFVTPTRPAQPNGGGRFG